VAPAAASSSSEGLTVVPLLVCRTCPRYEADSGSFGDRLDLALTHARSHGVRVRHVPCVGGCPHAGNIALDGPGKPRVRFSSLTTDDADDLLAAAAAYDASPTGTPGDWDVPAPLKDRLTAVTPKRVVTDGGRFDRSA
jgi:predicted metal-binding protein